MSPLSALPQHSTLVLSASLVVGLARCAFYTPGLDASLPPVQLDPAQAPPPAMHPPPAEAEETDAGADPAPVPDPPEEPESGLPDVVALLARAAHADHAPAKGDVLRLIVDLDNPRGRAVKARLTALLDSERFSDYAGVPLASKEVTLTPGHNRVVLDGGPFLSEPNTGKQYALGAGDYVVRAVRIEVSGEPALLDTDCAGEHFEIQKSDALLVPVVYDAEYFKLIEGNRSQTPEAYLEAAFERPNAIFTPSGTDPDGPGSMERFPGGFDQAFKVTHHFRSFSGFRRADPQQGWCENAASFARDTLQLATDWDAKSQDAHRAHHGFDYVIALTPEMGGGVACGWLHVQVSSFINRDLDRQQIIVVHETGHLFGAPHCDDVGDGAGAPLQGFVMCAGEKNASYPGLFVWHASSAMTMRSRWQ